MAGAVTAAETEMMRRHPTGFGRLLSVVDRLAAAPVEVALVGPPDHEATQALRQRVARRFLPALAVAGHDPRADGGEEGLDPDAVPLLAGRETVDGAPAAYVCRAYACRMPVTDAEALDEELDRAAASSDVHPDR